jgi:hypothetical protein
MRCDGFICTIYSYREPTFGGTWIRRTTPFREAAILAPWHGLGLGGVKSGSNDPRDPQLSGSLGREGFFYTICTLPALKISRSAHPIRFLRLNTLHMPSYLGGWGM